MKVAAKFFISMLIVSTSASVFAQETGSPDDGATSLLRPNPAAAGTGAGNNPQTNTGTITGLSKGSDGVISSMRANGTRTTESPLLRAPNRTGTMPRTR